MSIGNPVSAVVNHSMPKTLIDIQQFLELAFYYQKFIGDFAKIAAPINKLMRKDVPYIWTDKQQKAFELLKQKLMKALILVHSDFS